MDDAKIVDLYLLRDESAISGTQQKYGSKLRQIAYRILENSASAQECENDTYFKAWDLIPPHEPRTYLFAFLGRITRHLAIDECRKQNSTKRHAVFCELTKEMEECIPSQTSVEETAQANDLSKLINSFLGACSPEQQNVFVRRYWFFDSVADISRRYGFSQSKVKTMLFRMRENLKKYLEKEGYTI